MFRGIGLILFPVLIVAVVICCCACCICIICTGCCALIMRALHLQPRLPQEPPQQQPQQIVERTSSPAVENIDDIMVQRDNIEPAAVQPKINCA